MGLIVYKINLVCVYIHGNNSDFQGGMSLVLFI
jgi:hypothetical protein